MAESKPIHTIVLDAGPIIKNEPPISTLLAKSEAVVTTPAVLAEIRDETARLRVETTLRPFLTVRNPKPESVKIIAQFARKTGDVAVLSKPDIELLALAYELECERNGGDWRLRSNPGQKRTNGPPPKKELNGGTNEELGTQVEGKDVGASETPTAESTVTAPSAVGPEGSENQLVEEIDGLDISDVSNPPIQIVDTENSTSSIQNLPEGVEASQPPGDSQNTHTMPEQTETSEERPDSDSDSEGWITPSNIKRHQEKDAAGDAKIKNPEQRVIQVATISTDYALQNVLLQMNLNLLSTTMYRIKHLKTFILRCHACFGTTKDMEKQFCPRCGKPTLTRVTCTTNENGEFKLHLKKNMQWNTRGDIYSIPKPVSGASNGRVRGGGKGGWGNELILAEDQKEYVRALGEQKRTRQRDLMDEDYLPSILTGDRGKGGGRPKVGAGRNVNSKKR